MLNYGEFNCEVNMRTHGRKMKPKQERRRRERKGGRVEGEGCELFLEGLLGSQGRGAMGHL